MKKSQIKTFVHSIITFILIVSLLCFGIVHYNTLKKNDVLAAELDNNQIVLTSTQDELVAIQDKLKITQENLRVETERSIELNESLNTINVELENLNSELEIANTTIADLKNEEYKLVYMGNFTYTYYCNEPREHICGYGLGLTASGNPTEVGWTIAVDPSVIPLGTIVYVEGIGFRAAHDTGGGVKGNHIDILLDTHSECFEQNLVNGGVWVLVKKN